MVVVNGRDKVDWKPGLTVRGVLDALGWDYALITVSVNGDLVAPERFESHEVPDQADVRAIHIAHGG
jgi:sulfur carrier protein